MADLAIHESGDGGNVNLLNNDFELTEGLFNMVYLAWFGGNPGFPTTGNEISSEQRFDWWGNSLFFPNDPDLQFNSTLEYVLSSTPLNSQGRILIENAAKTDLKFLSKFAEVEVEVSIVSDNKVSIFAKLQEPDNLQEKEFQFIWDSTKNELIESITL